MNNSIKAAIILTVALTLAVAATTVTISDVYAKRATTTSHTFCGKQAGQTTSFAGCGTCEQNNKNGQPFRTQTCTTGTTTSGQTFNNCPTGAEAC